MDIMGVIKKINNKKLNKTRQRPMLNSYSSVDMIQENNQQVSKERFNIDSVFQPSHESPPQKSHPIYSVRKNSYLPNRVVNKVRQKVNGED